MKNFFTRMKEQIAVARLVRQVRKSGETGKLALVLEDELLDNRSWLAKRDMENQLMQQCIFGMMEGKSPCGWCEDLKECAKAERVPSGYGRTRGCENWFLRFLTPEEEKACEQRAAEKRAEDSAKLGGDDQGSANGAAV